jgi:tetraacyldisaccharide 4'-kinase
MNTPVRAARDPWDWLPRAWRGELDGPLIAALDIALAPASALFGVGVATRNRLYDGGLLQSRRAAIPVFSVGNLTVGGTGKTPFCAWLASRLVGFGRSPAIVLRGYGQDEIGVHEELNPDVPIFAAARRANGVAEAAGAGADCVVLDDGFQHRPLHRDLDIVLIAAEQWIGKRHLLPRGPWREPMHALERATHVFVTRKSASRESAESIFDELRRNVASKAGGVAHIAPTGIFPLSAASGTQPQLEGRRVVAITTLAFPTPFLVQLERLGARVDPMIFKNHHEFSSAEIGEIVRRAGRDPIIMTLKEAVKLHPLLPAEISAYVMLQEVRVEVGADQLDAALLQRLRKAA